ncbi:spermidine/putrescine ABC transporter ATP-binding protein (plasmid) [Mesorhizobium sp. 131-3-5]|uniref:ABC transporter ATP-binding protein n=1 Tax=Mesorhizobium sp. 131-3-5 TaxID=2744520 RepID=UPI0018EB7FD1|nr:ABC transporter ATP-binding protein [Mesorhizobium sp. 131-3-5]BCH12339.1 spermidine/putrescine ABC transporter ATP-binding protein [Mesorhizobium sp. 131-3-5]
MKPEETGARIEIAGLSKHYGAHAAVADVNLSIEPGMFMTFLGPSGSGKSTTLSMIAGFEKPTVGSILLDGRDISQLAPNARHLGMVFQQYALFPHMSVFENVAYPLRRRRLSQNIIRARVASVLDKVHLGAMSGKYPAQLSGGQQQRVAVARAIVFQPRALLMDEPFGALDRKLRDELQMEVMRLHRDVGSTFLFVTHDQEEALALSDLIAVFNHGRIEQVGTPLDLYHRPKTLFVAQFLGESNCFSGRIDGDRIVTDEGALLTGPTKESSPFGTLIVRPEQTKLLKPTDKPGGVNVISATITDIVFLGGSRRVVLRSLDRSREYTVRESGNVGIDFKRDDLVQIAWAPDAGHFVAR